MFTYDLATDIGKVRALIHDRQESQAIFTDSEVQTFLDLESSVKEAAALALETIAGQQALVMKVMKLLDLQMDGAAVAKALLSVAERLRASAEDDWCGFEIAEAVDNSLFAWTEKQWKLYMREAL